MRLSITALVITLSTVGILSGQGDATKTPPTLELQLEAVEKQYGPGHPLRVELERLIEAHRRAQGIDRPRQSLCVSSDSGTHNVSAVVETNGRRYRCVETYDEKFSPTGVSWTLADQK